MVRSRAIDLRLQLRTWEKLEALLDVGSPQEYEINDAVWSAEGQYGVLNLQNTPYCLEEQIRCLTVENNTSFLSGKVIRRNPSGGYGISVDLSEQDTKKNN
ncbi:hypothetical protein Tco_0559998 [Tanacetum coccineum]